METYVVLGMTVFLDLPTAEAELIRAARFINGYEYGPWSVRTCYYPPASELGHGVFGADSSSPGEPEWRIAITREMMNIVGCWKAESPDETTSRRMGRFAAHAKRFGFRVDTNAPEVQVHEDAFPLDSPPSRAVVMFIREAILDARPVALAS